MRRRGCDRGGRSRATARGRALRGRFPQQRPGAALGGTGTRPLMQIAAAARAGVLFVLAVAVAAGTSLATSAWAQQDQSCRIVRAEGAAFVERCGDRLNSFALVLDDISRSVGSDAHGRFGFVCPIEQMCQDKPEI